MTAGGRGLRLLMITQELAVDSSNMGVAHLWARELAPLVGRLHVIAATTGEVALPDNVTVHRLGKESGRGRAARWSTLLGRCHELIGGREVDGVLAHMVPAYALAASPWCLPRRIPLVLWYTSHGATGALRAAARLANAVVTASPESVPLEAGRAFVVGHGIDVQRLTAASPQSGTHELPVMGVAGRITPFKGLLTVIDAVGLLRDSGSPVVLHVAGVPFYPSDHAHLAHVHHRVRELNLTESVRFLGALPSSEMPDFYAGLDAFVAWRDLPSLDKTGLEALAAGTLLVSNNSAYRESLGQLANDFVVESSPEALANGLQRALALHPSLRSAAIKQLQASVTERHSADGLAARLVEVFTSLREHRRPPFPLVSPA